MLVSGDDPSRQSIGARDMLIRHSRSDFEGIVRGEALCYTRAPQYRCGEKPHVAQEPWHHYEYYTAKLYGDLGELGDKSTIF